jgi:hypothetical protein
VLTLLPLARASIAVFFLLPLFPAIAIEFQYSARHTGRGRQRPHDGEVATPASN